MFMELLMSKRLDPKIKAANAVQLKIKQVSARIAKTSTALMSDKKELKTLQDRHRQMKAALKSK